MLWVAAAVGAELRVGTLNCYLLFDPAVQHPGKLDDKERMTPKEYREKLGNLASLMGGYQVVALEEAGGKAEVQALATAAGMEWAWTKGRDTATGEEVGFLYRLPEWKMVSHGRVPELDSVVSKHLLVTLAHGSERIHFLCRSSYSTDWHAGRQASSSDCRNRSVDLPRPEPRACGDDRYSRRYEQYRHKARHITLRDWPRSE